MEPIRIKIQEIAEVEQPLLIEIRRYFHANPELSFQEKNTSDRISKLLSEWGIDHKRGIAGHGITGYIYGRNPDSRRVALRADMDALPILETNDCSYASTSLGIMHACGHDVHMTWLLGCLKILFQLRTMWEGTVQFVFQPGEEVLPGGASMVIQEGVFEHPRPDLILGQHVHPGLPVGHIGLNEGTFMASCDEIYLTIIGKGGHAAMAHLCIDPLPVAAEILLSLQTLISREKPANVPAVLSFGKMETWGGATNIIPEKVTLSGTFRCMDEEFRNAMHQRITDKVNGICEANRAVPELKIVKGYPCLQNEPEMTRQCIQEANQYLGSDKVHILEPRMTSEDFAYYSQYMPAVFYRTGIGRDISVHNSNFDIDEACLSYGAGLMAWLAVSLPKVD